MQGVMENVTKMTRGMTIPPEIPRFVRQKIEGELGEMWKMALKKASELEHEGLYALEHELRERTLKLAGQMLEAILERTAGTGFIGTKIACEHCGKSARFMNHRAKTILSLVFPFTIRRAYYWCQHCGWSLCPLDRILAVEGSTLSPGLKEAVVRVNAEVPFERAEELLKKLSGIVYDKKDAREVTETLGQELEEQSHKEIETISKISQEPKKLMATPRETPQAPERLYISPDGTTVPTEEGWKEVKVASIFNANIPKPGQDPVRERTRYAAGLEDAETFGKRLYAEALKQGLEAAQEIVFLGDGARWIWNEFANWLVKKRVEIVDFFHASEKIWAAAHAVFGETSPKAKAWAEHWVGVLYKGETDKVIAALKRLKAKGQTKNLVEQFVGYFVTNKERMRYGEFRKKGYFIGSGVTESSCKHLVASRLKQAGMCWTRKNVQAILQVRLAILNERWDHLWKPCLN